MFLLCKIPLKILLNFPQKKQILINFIVIYIFYHNKNDIKNDYNKIDHFNHLYICNFSGINYFILSVAITIIFKTFSSLWRGTVTRK